MAFLPDRVRPENRALHEQAREALEQAKFGGQAAIAGSLLVAVLWLGALAFRGGLTDFSAIGVVELFVIGLPTVSYTHLTLPTSSRG